MKRFAFKNRLFVTYTAVITLVVAVFSAVLLTATYRQNRSGEIYLQQEAFRLRLSDVEAVLSQMDRIAGQVNASNEIVSAFIPLVAAPGKDNHFAENLIDGIRISSLLSGINAGEHAAARVSVFSRGGDYISSGTLHESQNAIARALSDPAHYDGILEDMAGGGVLLSLGGDTWSDSGMRLLSLYRPLSSFAGVVYGIIQVQVGAGALSALPLWSEAGYWLFDPVDGQSHAFDGEGRLLSGGAGFTGAPDLPAVPGAIATQPLPGGGIRMTARLAPTGWLLTRSVSAAALLGPYVSTYWLMGAGCLALLLFLVLLVNYLAVRIARPLGDLAAALGNVNLGNIEKALEDTSASYATNELQALSTAFHDMLLRLDASVSMEIQAHMRALQSQMNPHFLYNMLSVIIESSEEEHSPRTVSMCLKLSAMLRYIADMSVDSVSLTEELAHARNYLDLMKDRYEDSFSYEVVKTGDISGVRVPKLTLQPLCENAFSHGFRGCRPPWSIRVEASAGEDGWRLAVCDNGTGITDEAAREIFARAQRYMADVSEGYRSLRPGGMGVVSTMLRLSLLPGGRVHFDIGRGDTGGTVIVVKGGPA